MPQFWIWLATAVCSIKLTLCQDCTSISIEPENATGRSLKWSFGVKEISFLIVHDCSSTSVVDISWTIDENATRPFEDGNISSPFAKQTESWRLQLTELNRTSSTKITLSSAKMNNSFLTVMADSKVTSSFSILFGHCEDEGNYMETRQVDCKIKSQCPGVGDVSGQKRQECNLFTRWIGDECDRNTYVFDFSGELKAPQGSEVEIRCNKSEVSLYDGTTSNETIIRNLSYEDHGETLKCYNNLPNDTDAIEAKFNVTSVPTFQHVKAEAVEGEQFNLRIAFHANPPIMRSDVQIMHSGEEITNFFFRSKSEILGEIMIDFPTVTAGDFGLYNITATGKDEYCYIVNETIVIEMTQTSKLLLSVAWIVAICLGGLAFILLIALIVICVKIRRRKTNDEVDITPVLTNSNKLNNSKQGGLRNQATKLQASHNNQSFDDDDDDEFDDDDYEQPTSLSERPPMPLPPTARGGGSAPSPPRSPRGAARPMQNRPQPPPPSSSPRPRPPPSAARPPPPPHRGMLQPPSGVGLANTLSRQMPGYEPRDYQEDYLNEEESRAATLRMEHRRR